jgi:flavin-dependent dehydrogenase
VTSALALPRAVFDSVLLEHARTAGVRVLFDTHVTELLTGAHGAVTGIRARHEDRSVTMNARLTVGADGLRSVIARRLHVHRRRPRLRKTSFTIHIPLASATPIGEMRVQAGACLGIAPVQPAAGVCVHNVTLVLNSGSFNARAGRRTILSSGLHDFGLAMPDIDDAEILASGPFDWPVHDVIFDGAALVGDAAGYYDPFTGEGIYHALAGAELLAEHAGRALRRARVDRVALQPYRAAHHQMVAATRRVQRLIEFVCSRPRLAGITFARIAQRPEIARTLIGVTGDLLPPASLLSPRLLMRLVT